MSGDTPTIRERRTPPAELGGLLCRARMRRGYRVTEAARLGGISHSHLCNLEMGRRVPSREVALLLAELYGLEGAEREELLAASVDDAGRGHWRRVRAEQRAADGPSGSVA